MAKALRKEVVLLGLSLPEDGYHAVNESFAWTQARGGMAASTGTSADSSILVADSIIW